MKKNWEKKRFEELIDDSLIGLVRNAKEQNDSYTYRYLKMDSITSDNQLDESKFVYVNASLDEVQKFSLKPGDFLFNTRNSYELVGKTCVYLPRVHIPTLFNNNILRVRFKEDICPKFINYCFSSNEIREKLKKLKNGTTSVVGIYYNGLKGLEIQIPSPSEQKRIVALLDECFTAIEKAKANAEQNLRNAKELFESYLKLIIEDRDGEWDERTIEDVTKVINGYAFSSKDFNPNNTLKSIKITNVGVREFVEETDNYLPERYRESLKEFQVREGNIVIALTRTIISSGLKVAIVPQSYDGAMVNQRVAAIIPNERLISAKYLYNYLMSDEVIKYVKANVKTLMQPNLSIIDLRRMPIPVPSLEMQKTIVQKLDYLKDETQRLQIIYEQKITALEELKKSILQKAFAGELVTDKEVSI